MVSSRGYLIFLNFLTHSFQIWKKINTYLDPTHQPRTSQGSKWRHSNPLAVPDWKIPPGPPWGPWLTSDSRFSTRVRTLKSVRFEKRVKSKFLYHFSNFDERTFKSQSDTHRGLLNHVIKGFSKNSNSFIASKLTNVADPPPLHDLDIFMATALSGIGIRT